MSASGLAKGRDVWYRNGNQANDENESGSQQRDAVRVTVQEAAILQSFPADFPWQGSRTAQFRQIGNAIPPGLARAILGAIVGTK